MKITKYLPLFGLVLLFILLMVLIVFEGKKETFNFSSTFETKESCNVSGIVLRGNLQTYKDINNGEEDMSAMENSSESIQKVIEKSEKDNTIKAIIIEIDSYGGNAVAGEEVANALKQAKKPTVALIRSAGVSAAYWAATGADIIYASKNSDVGSIGVTFSYLDNVNKNNKEGFTYHEISSAKFKDYGNIDKPLAEEERNLLLRDVYIIHENFVNDVAKNRNLDVNIVKNLADGSSMMGEMAVTHGLVDAIGDISEVRNYLETKIGEKVNICWS